MRADLATRPPFQIPVMDIERVGSQRVGSQAARRHPGWPTPRHGPARGSGGAVEPAHLSEILAIWRLSLICFPDDSLPYAILAHYLTNRDSSILVVRQGPSVAGFGTLWMTRDGGCSLGVIVSLGVDPVHRRRGIGRRLLREAYRWCQQAGAERLQLKVAQDNAVALTLFCSEGYRMVGRLPHYYGVGRHALRMERSAQPEGSAVDSLKPGPASAMISDIR